MDSLIAASARALAAGDAIGALKRVALREDPPALALRGIAMAQLGEHPRARELLRRAVRGFGVHEPLARARCVVAEAEVALAMRDLGGSPRALAAAAAALEARGDRANALHARLIAVRRWLLLGRLDEAEAALAQLDGSAAPATRTSTLPSAPTSSPTSVPAPRPTRAPGPPPMPPAAPMPPALAAVAALAAAELALRSLRAGPARALLVHAHAAAVRAGVPALLAEVADARAALERPAARRLFPGGEQALPVDDVAALLGSDALVVDACRRGVQAGDTWLPLARRPILFALARTLAQAWPGAATREVLIERAFNLRQPDETHRARLRVEIGRLRAVIEPVARIEATAQGFVLQPRHARDVVVLAPPIDGDQASLVALLADGAAWSTSALALALGASQRTVQRALAELEAEGRVRALGRARARRWLAPPLTGFTTILLLPTALPIA